MRTASACIVALLALIFALAACDSEPMSPEVTPSPTATATVVPSPSPTATPFPTPTSTPVPPTPTPEPSPTSTATPLPSPTLIPTSTPSPPLLPPGPEIEAYAVFEDCDFFLELADTPEERAVGLMGRESLERDRGMLFIFEKEHILGFWMKNTLIPLDIIFIDSNGVVVDVQNMRPEHETAPAPPPIHQSASPALYAIEVNDGAATECGIKPGDTVILATLNPLSPPLEIVAG